MTLEDRVGAMLRAANEANATIATVHERHDCPTCSAKVGERCRHIGNGRELKRPHERRWTLEVPKR
jgi:hypothetical protein